MTLFKFFLERRLMYFKIIIYDFDEKYVTEIDNYDLKNYDEERVKKLLDCHVTNAFDHFKKNRGYTISTTTIHVRYPSDNFIFE